MKRFTLNCFLLFAVSISAGFLPKLVKTQLTKGISMLLPNDFVLMNDDMLADKYNYPRRPTAMYTDPSTKIDVGVNITTRYWREEDIPLLKDIYQASIKTNYTKVEFIQSDLKTINKRQYACFEFVGTVEDQKQSAVFGKKPSLTTYNYLMYTVVDEQIVVVNFNCPDKLRTQWQATVGKIMSSVKIKHIKLEDR
ncbi:MAG: hypothetical protein ACFB0B_04375 [Thermonemataceae bacterium]